jgi:DNA polymerase III subunit chi
LNKRSVRPAFCFWAASLPTRLIQSIEYDKISVMSDLAFHTGVENRFKYACLAMRKAQRLNISACVLLETDDELRRFDNMLWAFEPTSFIPHGRPNTPDMQRGGVALSTHAAELPDAELLVLLTHGAPIDTKALMERFPTIIDIVGRDDPELTEGRHRYVAYKRQGIEPTVVKRG